MAISSGDEFLDSRLAFLRSVQNPDGGWGYFPGKQSWFEPTAYAVLALTGREDAAEALQKARGLIQTWQLPDGSWKPHAAAREGTWVTALGILISARYPGWNLKESKAVEWLAGIRGADSSLGMRLAADFHLLKTNFDLSHPGWPWRAGNSAWIEPTALSIIALRKSAACNTGPVRRRVREGEKMLLARRGRDGGWNYGNPRVFDRDLPSYPETTGLALLGLQAAGDGPGLLEVARVFQARSKTPLGSAWLAIAVRCLGGPLTVLLRDAPGTAKGDILLSALEALAHPQGSHSALQTGSQA